MAPFALALRRDGKIAQLVEQLTENQRVPGSIPGLATTLTPKILNKSSGFFLPALDHSVPGLGAVIGGAPGGLETSAGVSNALFFTGKFGVLSKVIAHRPRLAMAPSSSLTHSNYESSSHARPPW